LTDDATNHVWVFDIKHKNDADDTIQDWVARNERQCSNYTIKVLRSDRGGEFCYNDMRAWLTARGILHHLSCSYTP